MNSKTLKYSPFEIAKLLGQPAPTEQQAAVIAAPLEPLLVVAGAGSGKTETMAARVVYLVANGLVRPEEVLGLTFTRKAAGELQERVQKRLGQLSGQLGLNLDATNRPTIATYNSFAQSIVRENGLWVGIEPSAALLSEASAWQLMFGLVNSFDGEIETENALATVTKEILELDGELTEHLVELTRFEQYIADVTEQISTLPWGARKRTAPKEVVELLNSLKIRKQYLELVKVFRERKRELNSLTYGDQIAYAAKVATSVPAVSAAARTQYQVVLLDEYQDTSHAQVAFLSGLFGGGHPVTAVGDPNQAIYGWRGASASGLARFPSEFPKADGNDADVLPLATAWRNDRKVLEAANLAAEPLRARSKHIVVPPLQLSPKAGEGEVTAAVVETVADEASVIGDWIAARWGNVTAAVLCRARKQFELIAAALEERGIPYEIVGLGGLLDSPAVVDLVAILQAATDPNRGDWLLRLLTGPRVNLGAADLHALGSWAGDLTKKLRRTASSGAADVPIVADEAETRSLVDALDNLPAPGQAARDGRTLSDEGRHRLEKLARSIRTIRRHSYLSLPEICLIAERELGLDIELAITDANQSQAGPGRGRADLDAFRDVAANYARSVNHPSLAGFLGWLATAQERERGLDLPLTDVQSNAVQLITVHAAKGLEWDIVAVPGLVEGNFPSGSKSGGSGDRPVQRLHRAWLTNNGSIPYALRGDSEDLPTIIWPDTDQAEVAERLNHLRADSGAHELASERRLAYVAFTRARREMLLTGYWWGSQTKPREISLFLTELAEAGLVSDRNWAPPPDEGAENPMLSETKTAQWPTPPTGRAQRIQRGAGQVRAAMAELPVEAAEDEQRFSLLAAQTNSTRIADLAQLANLLLKEQQQDASQAEVTFPAQISASGLVRLAESRESFAAQLRRPIPMRPTIQAQVGTRFHEWVQGHYEGSQLLFDDDELWSDPDEANEADAGIENLKEIFLDSSWAELKPVAIEQEIHHTIAGVPVIARIDAVFPDPEQPEMDLVVDWKTGRPGSSEAERNAREVQLAVYRLAWAKLSGKPLDQVSAAFHYVTTNQTVRPKKLLSEKELQALIVGTV